MPPEPIVLSWQGRQLRVRHDDLQLAPYSPRASVIRAAVELASDTEGLRLLLMSALGDRYRVRVAEDGEVVGLWRRAQQASSPEPRTRSHGASPAHGEARP